ncbi:hypothetical protein BC829DRAFT_204049 [Chytridium lagenaria]|nr:hypothetical protein BC829DRAFT_204049 [Chytridium lagenaria]
MGVTGVAGQGGGKGCGVQGAVPVAAVPAVGGQSGVDAAVLTGAAGTVNATVPSTATSAPPNPSFQTTTNLEGEEGGDVGWDLERTLSNIRVNISSRKTGPIDSAFPSTQSLHSMSTSSAAMMVSNGGGASTGMSASAALTSRPSTASEREPRISSASVGSSMTGMMASGSNGTLASLGERSSRRAGTAPTTRRGER